MPMSDSEVLAAEYRAFVRALHPASIKVLVAIDVFWLDQVYPLIRPETDKEAPARPVTNELYGEFARIARPELLTLATGHPDPDVRAAAEALMIALERVVVSHIGDRPSDPEGTALIVAVLDYLRALRRAVYRAPFRIERPTPVFDGELLVDGAVRKLVEPGFGPR